MTQDKATPRPWELMSGNIRISGELYEVCRASDLPSSMHKKGYGDNGFEEQKDNAELIVRAVNSHEALVRALTDAEMIISAIECGKEKPVSTGFVLDQARQALALAEGK